MAIHFGLKLDMGWAVRQTTDGGYIVAGYTQSFGAGWQDVYLIKTDSLGDTLWTKTYGGVFNDLAWAVQQTRDDGYIVAGYTQSFGAGFDDDVYLIKTDANGDMLWTKIYGGGTTDRGLAVQQTGDNGYIVAGYTQSFGAGWEDVYLIKTDSIGDTLWTRTYGGVLFDLAYAVQQTTDGGYFVAGQTFSFGAGNYDVYLIKTDSLGDTLWTKTYGGINGEWAYAVQQTTDGGYIMAGLTWGFGAGNYDVYLIKTDANGNSGCNQMGTASSVSSGAVVNSTATLVGSGAIVNATATIVTNPTDTVITLCFTAPPSPSPCTNTFQKTFGGINAEEAYAVEQTTDGGYIVAGSTGSFGAGAADVYLIKTNANGDTLWTKTYGGGGNDIGYAVQQTTDGGYIVAGYTNSFGAGSWDVYLIKTNSVGDTLWTKTYGGAGSDYVYAVQQTTDEGYIVVGRTTSFGAGITDVYLIKTDANGDTLWTKTYGGTLFDEGWAVQQTTDGGYIVAGSTWLGAGVDDVYLIKTDSIGDTLWTRTYGGVGSDYGFAVQQTNDGGYIVAGRTLSFSPKCIAIRIGFN